MRFVILLLLLFTPLAVVPVPGEKKKVPCKKIQSAELTKKLGPAFNGRYMSVEKPRKPRLKIESKTDESQGFMSDQSRGLDNENELDSDFSFKVTQNYSRILKKTDITPKTKRQVNLYKTFRPKENFPKIHDEEMENKFGPWSCTYKYKWIDLGGNHFPRYLRTVECDIKVCWFGFYECTPRAFTVTVLKRTSDSCFLDGERPVDGQDVVENWEFEERAVAFCCECLKSDMAFFSNE